MTEKSIDAALEDLVERYELESGGWDDVLRRAATVSPVSSKLVVIKRDAVVVPAHEQRRRRRRLLVAAAVVVAAAGGVIVTPAFGLRSALLDLIGRTDVVFERSQPAPTAVRHQFEDLALGAPPSMDPGVIPQQARQVTFFFGGKKRVLSVTPTTRGGFCYLIAGLWGGCMRNGGANDRTPPIAITYKIVKRPGESLEIPHIGGTVHDSHIARLTLRFRDGTRTDIPFVWISSPISAGFFAYELPPDQRKQARGPSEVVAEDNDGTIVWREAIRFGARLMPR
jgi:hypothetical protein